jgi:hypothetical protein|tara:strand:- start:1260 stop:1592 length:333 start_codon:yes stop_codon:yes gene_type:complete
LKSNSKLLGLLIVIFGGCTNAPNGAFNFGNEPLVIQDGEFKTLNETPRHKRDGYWLTDYQEVEHCYKLPIVYTSKQLTEYCMVHRNWENISSRWSKHLDMVTFIVGKNKK